MAITMSEIPIQVFWLRKIEGAEIFLAYETNFFRQGLHRMNPVTPNPPPIQQESLSTKQQKLMAQYDVKCPKDLPQHLRTKARVLKPKGECQPRSASDGHALSNPPHEPSRNHSILVQMQSDFSRYHGET